MTLGQKQELFSIMLCKLLSKMDADGYGVRTGDVWAHDVNGIIEFMEAVLPYLPEHLLESRYRYLQTLNAMRHMPNSCHYYKLAADLNLFKDGRYLTKTEDHKPFGEYWESLGGAWGGHFGDANHYSLEHGGRK